MSFNIPDDTNTKRPMTKRPKDKTSQETKRLQAQNVPETKRPKVEMPGKLTFCRSDEDFLFLYLNENYTEYTVTY